MVRASRIAAGILIAPIQVYRLAISPLFPPSCRFSPSCSTYAIEALKTHGPVKGLALATRRLLRCHPITWLGGASGFDPVPPRRS
jgi:putative membrane protein insertion efficiency factor